MGTHDSNEIDDLLDGALKRYGEVEPRIGLEGRVLAMLAGTDRQPHWSKHWIWGLGLAVVGSMAIAVVAVLLMRIPRTHEQPIAVHPSAGVYDETLTQKVSTPTQRKPRARAVRVGRIQPELAKAPRRREFPSPRPLSEQERLLKTYVSNFPQEAALVAREQAEREKQLAAMGWNTTVVPDSN